MLQDLYPHIYHNEMAWKVPAPDDYALIFAPDGTVYAILQKDCTVEGYVAVTLDIADAGVLAGLHLTAQ